MNVEEHNYIESLRESVNTAQAHLEIASAAHTRGDSRGLEAAHRALGHTLRGMHRTFESLGKAGAAADQAATQTVQTSSGAAKSDGSAGGRGSPLYYAGNAGIPGFLARARQGGRRS